MQTIDKQNQQIRFRTLSRIWRVLTLTTMILTLEQLSFRPLARIRGVLTKRPVIINGRRQFVSVPSRGLGGSNLTVDAINVRRAPFPSPLED